MLCVVLFVFHLYFLFPLAWFHMDSASNFIVFMQLSYDLTHFIITKIASCFCCFLRCYFWMSLKYTCCNVNYPWFLTLSRTLLLFLRLKILFTYIFTNTSGKKKKPSNKYYVYRFNWRTLLTVSVAHFNNILILMSLKIWYLLEKFLVVDQMIKLKPIFTKLSDFVDNHY